MAALSSKRRGIAEVAGLARQPQARLVIVRQSDDRFVLRHDGPAPECPEISLSAARTGATTLGGLVETNARLQLGIRLSYLGLLSLGGRSNPHEFVALASLKPTSGDPPTTVRLQPLTQDEARDRGMPAEQLAWLESATRRRRTEKDAASLGPMIRQAFDRSLKLLDGHVARESDRIVGWSQYLDGTVGLLSTAQGLLAYVHAGRRGSVVDEAAATLEAIQNPDGGWQVRRALVGAPSPLSLTESTCYCLWALFEAGRTATDESVRRGVAWLEQAQGADGGWRPSLREGDVQVSATAAAVRTLALFGKTDAVRRGLVWLRTAQRDDGGWAEKRAPKHTANQRSSPAHTAHAVIALLAAGVPPSDPDVEGGCEYLEQTFRAAAEEPWRATSTNTIVDDETKARLDYRHFATPWALAALSRGGHDLSDPTVLNGAKKLLGLQESDGTWRCSLTAPSSNTVWALHDALFALRTLLDAGTKDLKAAAMAAYWDRERNLLQEAIVRLLVDNGAQAAAAVEPRRHRSLFLIGWTSLPALGVVVLAALRFGWWPAIIAGLGALSSLGTLAQLVVGEEEFKLWRTRHSTPSRSQV